MAIAWNATTAGRYYEMGFNRFTIVEGKIASHDFDPGYAGSVDGTLEISIADGYTPNPGDVFDLFDFDSGYTGSFDNFVVPVARTPLPSCKPMGDVAPGDTSVPASRSVT